MAQGCADACDLDFEDVTTQAHGSHTAHGEGRCQEPGTPSQPAGPSIKTTKHGRGSGLQLQLRRPTLHYSTYSLAPTSSCDRQPLLTHLTTTLSSQHNNTSSPLHPPLCSLLAAPCSLPRPDPSPAVSPRPRHSFAAPPHCSLPPLWASPISKQGAWPIPSKYPRILASAQTTQQQCRRRRRRLRRSHLPKHGPDKALWQGHKGSRS